MQFQSKSIGFYKSALIFFNKDNECFICVGSCNYFDVPLFNFLVKSAKPYIVAEMFSWF